MALIGRLFAGAIASSHAFLSLSVSVSSVVGGFRAATLLESLLRCFPPLAAVYPGGSGTLVFFGRGEGVEFRSRIHCGGGGGGGCCCTADMT